MKTFSILTLAVILSAFYAISHAQSWELNGNSTIDPNDDFVGTTDDNALRFRTDNTFRMGLTGVDGFLGINTTTPAARFHMVDGAFVVSGNTGSNPNLGAGARMMWIPDRWAFRAGQVTGTNWDAPNVGVDSFAVRDNRVSDAHSETASMPSDLRRKHNHYHQSPNGAMGR